MTVYVCPIEKKIFWFFFFKSHYILPLEIIEIMNFHLMMKIVIVIL